MTAAVTRDKTNVAVVVPPERLLISLSVKGAGSWWGFACTMEFPIDVFISIISINERYIYI